MKLRKIRLLVVFMLLFVMLSSVSTPRVLADNSKNILIINSYHKGLTWTDEEMDGITDELYKEFPDSKIMVEYLDWKNYPNEENLELQYNLLKYKYSNQKVDLLITTDDTALDFAIKNRADLFADAPVVFCGINQDGVNKLTKNYSNFTGVVSEVNPMETVKRALEIMPNMKKIYVLYDNTESGISTGKMTEDAVRQISPEIEIIALNNMNLEEIIEETRKAQSDSVILITIYYVDADGKNIGFEAFTKIISANSSVPVFNLYDFSMGYGAIGGNLLSGKTLGEGAGKLAVRVLKGEAISDIPVQTYASTHNIFDYEQLQRFHIPLSKLPKD
ncbi:MAG: diguanylate cyclase/phosphodiesterase, partial [Clostridia bacterium]|nr:diguanylate cyclase/phosphodiesterase [Clostridia bacterium]